MSSPTLNLNPYEHLRITVRPDGSLTRIPIIAETPSNPEGAPGDVTLSKDVSINPETKVQARIFRPNTTIARFPIIFYIHGGGFVLFSAANAHDHKICSTMAAKIPAIVVSVDHRLAPENRLPSQYEDAVDTILWVKQQAAEKHGGEEWLRSYGDFNRCYLIGRGSGANIAFHAGIRTAGLDLNPLKMCGMILNQPMFSGKVRSRSEVEFSADVMTPLAVLDLLWELALPKGSDRDHPFSNPKSVIEKLKEKSGSGLGLGLGKLLVVGLEMDPLGDRMREFSTELSSLHPGLSVETRFNELGFHNMEIVDDIDSSFQTVLNLIKDFVTSPHLITN